MPSRCLVLLLMTLYSFPGDAASPIDGFCRRILIALQDDDPAFVQALRDEPDPNVREFALVIKGQIRRTGKWTEAGAHGQDLSWKHLGLVEEPDRGGRKRYRVVGYGNYQFYPEPYAEMARDGKVRRISVATNLLTDHVFVTGKELRAFPPEVQSQILRALQLALQPERIRIFDPREEATLWNEGKLPSQPVRVSLSVEVEKAGMKMVSVAPEQRGKQLSLQIAPEYPIIIGRGPEAAPYLKAYKTHDLGSSANNDQSPENTRVSRAHFMLLGTENGEVVIVNGVPSKDGIRAPLHGTWITLPGQTERRMLDGERLTIRLGSWATVRLPNGFQLRVELSP